MEQQTISHLIAGLALATTFGGMTFFSAVMAPLVFMKLPMDVAGGFIRQVFPWYYLSMGSTALVALVAWSLGSGGILTWQAGLITLVLAGFVFVRQILMPLINQARDAQLAGEKQASRRFNQLHRLSVIINALQWLAVLIVLIGVLV
jgi:hypothetical protein